MNRNALDIPALLRLRGDVPQGAVSVLCACGDLSSHGAVLVFLWSLLLGWPSVVLPFGVAEGLWCLLTALYVIYC